MLNKLKRKIIGNKYTAVDFGHHSLKVVQGKVKNNSLELMYAGSRELEPGALEEGEVADVSLVAASLQNILQEGIRRQGKILFVPAREQIVVRIINVPDMPESELRETLRWEIDDYLPMAIDEVKMEFLPLEQEKSQQRVLVAVIPENVLNGYKEVFSRLNISPHVANLQELSLFSLLNYQQKLNQITAIIDMGANNLRVIIAREKNIYLSRSTDIGGSDFTEPFMEESETWLEAEQQKQQTDLLSETGRSEEDELDMDLMIEQLEASQTPGGRLSVLAEEAAEQIERSLNYYSSQHRGDSVDKILYTGGGFRLSGLVKKIEGELDRNMELIDPLYGTSGELDTSAVDRYRMAVAVGLIISEVVSDES